jgi:hypothetical protein
VESAGVGLNVVEDGPTDGVPIVALHGILGSVETYDFLPGVLTGHRLVRMFGATDEPDSLRADGIAFSRVDPAVFETILDGSIVAGFDPDIPIGVPGVLLKTDPGAGGAFLERDVARLHASNPQIEIVTVTGAGHLMHGARAHRCDYIDHLQQFLDRSSTRAANEAAGS